MSNDPDDSRLSAYHDAMLGPRELRAVRDHLAREPEARREYQDLSRTVAAVRGLPDPTAPPQFWDQTFEHLRQRALADERPRPRAGILEQPLRLAVALAVCALALLVAWQSWAAPDPDGLAQRSTAAERVQRR